MVVEEENSRYKNILNDIVVNRASNKRDARKRKSFCLHLKCKWQIFVSCVHHRQTGHFKVGQTERHHLPADVSKRTKVLGKFALTALLHSVFSKLPGAEMWWVDSEVNA